MRSTASKTLPARIAAVAAVLIASWGCGNGDGLARQAISGKVTLDNQPLDAATITFTPTGMGPAPTSGVTKLSNGSFALGKSEGLVPGKYRVSISLSKEVPVKPSSKQETDSVTGEVIAPPTSTLKETLPDRYNSRSELSADITQAGPNDFTFTLTSK